MNQTELLSELLRGRLLLVGEYRGSTADEVQYVDDKSGEVISYIKGIHLIECCCRGNLDRATITERLPEIVERSEEAQFPYQKGSLYVFRLESFEWKRGQVTGRMLPGTKPALIESKADSQTHEGESGDAGGAVRRASATLSP